MGNSSRGFARFFRNTFVEFGFHCFSCCITLLTLLHTCNYFRLGLGTCFLKFTHLILDRDRDDCFFFICFGLELYNFGLLHIHCAPIFWLHLFLKLEEFWFEAKCPTLLEEHGEGFRGRRLLDGLALYQSFVRAAPTNGVIRFNREHLLQDVRCAVGFECPHLHFSKALTAMLCLASERLLGDEGVGTNGAGMDLILYEVEELQHVDDADCCFVIEGFPCASIVELHFAVPWESSSLEEIRNLLCGNTVQGGSRKAESQPLCRPPEVSL